MKLPKQSKPVSRNNRKENEKAKKVEASCAACGPNKSCYGVCTVFGCAGYCG